jgi:hypothetical protein
MRADAERQLEECRTNLRRLPEAERVDPIVEVLRLVNEFCQDLNSTVYGYTAAGLGQLFNQAGSDKSLGELTAFVRCNRETYEDLKRKMRATAPDFRPFEDHEDYVQPTYNGKYDQGTVRNLRDVRQIIKE